VLAVVLALAALVAAPASALPADDKATRFHVDFVLNRDGSVSVTENITWQFPDDEERHGIERLIKVRAGWQDQPDTFRVYEMSDVSARSTTGAPDDVSVTEFGAYDRIRVGRADETVSGRHSYVVQYTLANYVNGFDDHAEFYFNLVDPSNESTYENVTATVRGSEPVDRVECFHGELGSTRRCTGTPGASATFSAGTVPPGEGASILASLPRTAFDTLEPELREGQVTEDGEVVVTSETARALGLLAVGTGVALPLLAGGVMGALVHTRGRDERYAGLTPGLTPGHGEVGEVVRGGAPTVAVQFTPPAGVQPGMLGLVVDEVANTVDVAATVVDLAVRGHLTLERVDHTFSRDDWRLTRTGDQPTGAPLHRYERELLNGLFASRSSVLLSELRNHFSSTLELVKGQMYAEVVERGWFRRSPETQRRVWTSLGALMVFGGAVGTAWLGGAVSDLMPGHGLPVPPVLALGAGVVAAGAITWFLGRRMAARTADGSAVMAQSLGFRQYLVTAEANQIRWEEAQDLFSRFLPYAIVFGVADRWASTFEEVAVAAAAAGHPLSAPGWYVGSFDGSGGFTRMASSMDSFATTAGGTFTSTPGSSGSSGFSMGGGFSGGGGGGSGGGSW
jgi:uncharacterized membrane protein YgcG